MADARPLEFNNLPDPAAGAAEAWLAWQRGVCDLAAVCSYAAEEGLEAHPANSNLGVETLFANGAEFDGVRPYGLTYEQVAVGGMLQVGDLLRRGHVVMHEVGFGVNHDDGSSTMVQKYSFDVFNESDGPDGKLERVESHEMPVVSVTMHHGKVLEEGTEPSFDADPHAEIPEPTVPELVDMHAKLRRTAQVVWAMLAGHGMELPGELTV